MAYTVLAGDEADAAAGEVEGFMAIATSDYSFIILRISKHGQQEILAELHDVH